MLLFKVTRPPDEWGNANDYDTYAGFVVCAESEMEARYTRPYNSHVEDMGQPDSWVPEDELHTLTVTLIGTAIEGLQKGIILSDYKIS